MGARGLGRSGMLFKVPLMSLIEQAATSGQLGQNLAQSNGIEFSRGPKQGQTIRSR